MMEEVTLQGKGVARAVSPLGKEISSQSGPHPVSLSHVTGETSPSWEHCSQEMEQGTRDKDTASITQGTIYEGHSLRHRHIEGGDFIGGLRMLLVPMLGHHTTLDPV